MKMKQYLQVEVGFFCATALGSDLKDAQKNAYNLVNNVEFDGAFFRKDIGFKGIK